MKSKKGAAEWFWILIGIVLALVVAISLLFMYFDFGEGIKTTFDRTLGLTDNDAGDLAGSSTPTANAILSATQDETKDLLSEDAS